MKMHTLKITHISLLLLIITLLSSCGLHPRSPQALPPQLKMIYLNTEQPYSGFATKLKSMLRSMNIRLAATQQTAPYSLRISAYNFTQSNSSITTTTLAVTFTYTITLKISIETSQGKIIVPPKTISASRDIVQTASQVYTPGSATLTKEALQRDIITQIYYFLASEHTKRLLSKHHVSQSAR